MRMKLCFYIYHNNKSTYKDLDGGEKKSTSLYFLAASSYLTWNTQKKIHKWEVVFYGYVF